MGEIFGSINEALSITEPPKRQQKKYKQGRSLRSTNRQSQTEQKKLAVTDHLNTENHVINWNEATVVSRESDRTTRWIKEADKIQQESQGVMKKDEGSHQLSHINDDILLSVATSGTISTLRKSGSSKCCRNVITETCEQNCSCFGRNLDN